MARRALETAVAFGAILTLSLAACGGSDSTPASTGGPEATTPDGAVVGTSDDDGGTTDGAATDGAAATPPGSPSADALLAKLAACKGTALKGGFGADGPGSISIFACGNAAYWKADMDVDCDGIQTPPCNTDPQGQPQTSVVDIAPKGDVDPTVLPYFVIPLGLPETTWYTAHGIQLGQVGAVIYKGQVRYGIFADEAGGWFIGEVSYAMCQLFLGKPSAGKDPCDPNTGGIDPSEISYVTFTGAQNQMKGADLYDHAKHTQVGAAAAAAWVAVP
jgi:hypothetical protein